MDEKQKSRAYWLCLTGLLFTMAVKSIQVPFFPAVASRKHVTATEYGFVFSIYEMVKVAITPFMGFIMRSIGVKFMLCIGLLISSLSCCIFGFLDMISSRDYFLVYAFLLRILESIGQTAFEIGTFSFVIAMYANTSGEKMGILMGAIAFGYVFGPCIGGAFYYLGGFLLPFLVQGVILAFVTILTFKVIPEKQIDKISDEKGMTKQLLKLKESWPGIYCAFAATYCTGFTFTTIEPHLRQFNLELYAVSLVCLADPVMYALTSSIYGKLMDRGMAPYIFMIIGTLLKILSFSLFGPLPVLGWRASLPLIVGSLGINGLGNAAQYVSSLGQIVQASKILDSSMNLDRTSEVSVVYRFSFCFGILVGTLAGGLFLDHSSVSMGALSGIACQIPVLISGVLLGVTSYPLSSNKDIAT